MSEAPIDPEFSPVPVPDPIIPGWLFWTIVGIAMILAGVAYYWHTHKKIDREIKDFMKDPDHPRWNSTFSKRPNKKEGEE